MKTKHPTLVSNSVHQQAGKDRALTNALLRVSERTANQERTKADDVIYCGEDEPLFGWTNAAPNPRYSQNKRPKHNSKRKKLSKKLRRDLERLEEEDDDDDENIFGFHGLMASSIVDRNQTYSMRDMYDGYKKAKQIKSLAQKHDIVHPETYEYVPWNERMSDNPPHNGKIRLPTLKMVHASKPSKLAGVLEKYVNSTKASNRATLENTITSLVPEDMLAYYDKYKWNFDKVKNKRSLVDEIKQPANKRRIEHFIHLPAVNSGKKRIDNLEPNVKERLVRYVNGAVRNKRNVKSLYKDGKKSYFIKLRDGDAEINPPSMVKLERKREKNERSGEPSDHWVARVIIKQTNESGSDQSKHGNDSESSSSVVFVPDARWRRKIGVVERERERIQREMERLHFHQQQQMKINRMRRGLLPNDVADKSSFKIKQKGISHRIIPTMFSTVETAKVSVKYNVETSKRKGVVREVSDPEPTLPYLDRLGIPQRKTSLQKGGEIAEKRHLAIGEDHVTKILPPGREKETTSQKVGEAEQTKNGRLFLKKGAALKKEQRRPSIRNATVKLPVLPKQAKLEKPNFAKLAKRLNSDENRETDNSSAGDDDLSDDASSESDVISSLVPVVHGASATFHAALNGEVGITHVPKSPSSSTFNSEELMRQVVETANFLGRKPNKNTEFIRFKVIPQPGSKISTECSSTERRPIHPPHTKNRGQEKIQDMIDQEKGAVKSLISHLNSSAEPSSNNLNGQADNYKAALTTAISKAKMLEEAKQVQIPNNLANGNHVIMKRRVVPPIVASAVNTTVQSDADQTQLPVISTSLRSNGECANSQDDSSISSHSKEQKRTKRNKARAKKRNQEWSKRRNAHKNNSNNNSDVADFDHLILSGDVIVKERPTPKLLEHNFAASIMAVKPTRRIVHAIPQRIIQKG